MLPPKMLEKESQMRMIGYGALDARIKPGVPAQPLCAMVSAAASSNGVSVLQRCPGQADLRLTLLVPADQEDETIAELGGERQVVEYGQDAQTARTAEVTDERER